MVSSNSFCHSSVRQPIHCNGCTNQPKVLARLAVDVVMARSAERITARSICTQTKEPINKPSRESQLKPHKVRPGENKRCINKVKSKSQRSSQQRRQTGLVNDGTSQKATETKTIRMKLCAQSVAVKASITSSRQDKTFTRGSSLCRNVCPGW